MAEEKLAQPEEIQDTSDGGRLTPSEVEGEAMTPPRWREKIKLHKFKILGGILGVLVFTGAVFGAYKFGQRQIQPTLQPPSSLIQPRPTATPQLVSGLIGTGLREETAPILVAYKDCSGLVTSTILELSKIYFPQLDGWIRILAAPSLKELQQKAEQAKQNGVPYEALGYSLETGESTPDEEWQDLVGSTQKAKDIASRYDKQLAMGPGLKLMSQNEEKYAPMAALADIWIFQTQRLQISPPGPVYRREAERIVSLIKSGNPNIPIWAQITFPPDREPNAEEWLAYRQSIIDLVDGTYVGAYTWRITDPDKLVGAIKTIFTAVCGSQQ